MLVPGPFPSSPFSAIVFLYIIFGLVESSLGNVKAQMEGTFPVLTGPQKESQQWRGNCGDGRHCPAMAGLGRTLVASLKPFSHWEAVCPLGVGA